MKIAILGAMDQEVALLKASLADVKVAEYAHLQFYSGKLHDTDVVVAKCGIGKVSASVTTTILIDQYAPDFVVNTGSAGGFDPNLDLGMPDIYPCDVRLIEAAENAARDVVHVNSKRGLICTGDSFIGCDEAAERLRNLFPDMCAVEMEGAAIGQTCFMFDTPFLVIRSLSDIAGKSSPVSFKEYLDKAAQNSAHLVMGMVKSLQHLQG